MIPPQPALGPARVGLDEVPQRVAGFPSLTHRFDAELPGAAPLPPSGAVMPDLATLDLDADDARALDGHQEVDLMIFEVVGDPLAGDDEVALAELLHQFRTDPAFGGVGQPRVLGKQHRHISTSPEPTPPKS